MRRLLQLLFLSTLVVSGCDSASEDPAPVPEPPPEEVLPSIADYVRESDALATLETALVQTGLLDELDAEGPFTLFAPTDLAFGSIGDDLGLSTEELLARDDVADILRYHLVSGAELGSEDLQDGDVLTMADGRTLTVVGSGTSAGLDTDGDGVADASLYSYDRPVSNGVVHTIDAVLSPIFISTQPTLVDVIGETSSLSGFAYLLSLSNDSTVLAQAGPFTVFAPTNAAIREYADARLGMTEDAFYSNPPASALTALRSHIVPNQRLSFSELQPGDRYDSLNPERSVCIAGYRDAGGTYITVENDISYAPAEIVGSERSAPNGTVHLVNAFLVEYTSPNTTCQ